jgi:hypothetical protein
MNVADLSEYRRYCLGRNLYTNGMNLAQTLRELRMHEEAHQLEVWVLALRKELTEKTDMVSETSEVTK